MKTKLDRTTRLTCSPKSLQAEVQNETVLMSVDNGNCYGLDDTASDIWRLLKSSATVADVQQACRERYAGAADQIDADVLETLQWMADEGLVTVKD